MLSVLIGLPIAGAIALICLPNSVTAQQIRSSALAISGIIVLLTLGILAQFDLSNPGLQYSEYLPWLPFLGLDYQLGIDGISVVLLALNSVLTAIAIYSSSPETARPRLFYALILLINAGVTGAFAAQNLLLFFLFYELELVPFYLLISIWGSAKRSYAAVKFLIYTAISGALVLVGFLGVTWLTGASSFAYQPSLGQLLPADLQLLLLGIIIVGFGIKMPLVPFHTWLPDTYVESSTPVTMLLGGVFAKLGTYGILRFGLGLFPEAWSQLAPWLALWAAVSVLYGAMAAIAQTDMKRMIAYSSIGHMGYVLLGGAAVNTLSLSGAVAQMVAHGLIVAILFHLIGVVEAKVGTRDLAQLNGLMNPIRGLPTISSLLVLGSMASAGIPGLAGFVAEFLVFQGSFSVFPIATLIAVIGTGLTAVYFVILLNRTCFGKLNNTTAYYPTVHWHEKVPALILASLIIFLGIQPTWLVKWSEPTLAAIVAVAPQPSFENTPKPKLSVPVLPELRGAIANNQPVQ